MTAGKSDEDKHTTIMGDFIPEVGTGKMEDIFGEHVLGEKILPLLPPKNI